MRKDILICIAPKYFESKQKKIDTIFDEENT